MSGSEAFIKKNNGKNCTENRHEVDKWPGNIGPKLCNGTVPENKGKYRCEKSYIDNGDTGVEGELHCFSSGKLEEIKWQ